MNKEDQHTYTIEYYSAIKKNEIIPFEATWMDLEIIILNEVSQKEKSIPYDIIYMWNLKYNTKNLPMKQTQNRFVLAMGVGRTGSLGLGDTSYYIQNG